jgi:hypothetical protein
MAWKRKEKPLSPEEAIALAKRELAPFWYHSEPLLAAVKTPQGASALPLDPEFVKQPWLFFFVDPGEFSGESAFHIAREWHRRFHSHKLRFLAFLRPTVVGAMGGPELLKRMQIPFPTVVDQESLFARAFGIKDFPAVVLQSNGQELLKAQGGGWMDPKQASVLRIEEKIQAFLRSDDPGLSLALPYEFHQGIEELGRVDFGSSAPPSKTATLNGSWTQGEDFIRAQDPSATLEFTSPGPSMSMIVRSSLETQSTKILIESLDGSFDASVLQGEHNIDENGRATIRIHTIGLYHLLKDLPAGKRRVRFSFPDSETVPVIIYGLRFGK